MPKISGLLKELTFSVPKQDFGDVREAIFNALMRIIQSNRPFMDAHPNLFCRKCRRKSAKIEFKENPVSQTFAVAACPLCLNTAHLLTGIMHITGVIGGNLVGLNRKDKKITLPVWDERKKSAQYADIDFNSLSWILSNSPLDMMRTTSPGAWGCETQVPSAKSQTRGLPTNASRTLRVQRWHRCLIPALETNPHSHAERGNKVEIRICSGFQFFFDPDKKST